MPKVMAQPSAGQGRSRGRRVSTSLSEINIIPLVDVMLVLLIIFMVAAPMMQRGVEVNLPVASRTQPVQETRVYVTVPLSYRDDGRVYIEEEAVPIAALAERLRQINASGDPQDVFLRGDALVYLQEFMDVIDELRQGGIERVGIVSRQGARQ
jgi:biopolymer transport protein TolR